MPTTLYIIKDADGYRFGTDPVVQLWEPESISRTWIRRVIVDLPEGFEVGNNQYDEPLIYRSGDHYHLGTNKAENPVIIDHTSNGAFIPLKVLSEGWE